MVAAAVAAMTVFSLLTCCYTTSGYTVSINNHCIQHSLNVIQLVATQSIIAYNVY